MKSKAVVIFLLFSVLISAFIYKNSFSAYFFQDDWFTLRISWAKNINGVLQFFVPRKDVIYYRPLGMQMPFFILRSLFGVNPLPFHILTFVTHTVNIFLVFVLVKLIKKDMFVASLSAFIYAVSAVFYIPMFWSATYAFVLGPTFFFLSFILYILSLKKRAWKYYALSLIVNIFGLLTNEITAVLPLVIFSHQLFIRKVELKKLLPYLSAVLGLFVLRFFIFPPPLAGSYQLGVGKDVLLNLRAYVLWSFNWPEEMKAQFISFFKVNPQFIRDFALYFWSFIGTLFLTVTISTLIPLTAANSQRKKDFFRLSLFSFSWFVFGLLPVIFFTQHAFSYYLSVSLVGLTLFITSLFTSLVKLIYTRNKLLAFLLVLIFVLNWTYSSFTAVDFNSKVHWAPRRAKLSKILTEETKRNNLLSKNDMIFIRNLSENKLALNDQDAFKVIYNNDKIITIYGQ